MSVVGVIPARWASTRLPGKSLVTLAGRPLIEWVVENAARARTLDRLIVATDDERIAEALRALPCECAMTRPDHPSGTDRLWEAVGDLEWDVVVNIQGDEPLLDPALIDRLAQALLNDVNWDMATAVTAIESSAQLEDPSVVKAVWAADGRALYFSRAPIPCVRDETPELDAPLHWRHLGIYAYRRDFLRRFVVAPPCATERAEKLEQLRALHLGARLLVLTTSERGIGVDTPEDVKYVESLLVSAGGKA